MTTDPPGRHLTGAAYPYEETPPMSQPTPHAPQAQESPEPLIKAEAVRAILVLVVAAVWGGIEIPDPILNVAVDGLVGVIAIGVSWALTWITRGKVWALRQGVDVDAVVDEVQARTR